MPAYAMVTVCTDVHVHCTCKCTSTVHVHAQYIHVHSTVHGVLIMYTVHVQVCGGGVLVGINWSSFFPLPFTSLLASMLQTCYSMCCTYCTCVCTCTCILHTSVHVHVHICCSTQTGQHERRRHECCPVMHCTAIDLLH